MRLLAWLVGLAFFIAPTAWAAKPVDGLDAVVESLRAEGSLPAMAVVIVKDDKVVVARGYGDRTNADTLFGIASLTKAFTATGLAMLVDRGTLGFDDALSTALPGFKVADPYVTAHATVRDALAHRTGVASADLLWYGHRDSTVSALLGAAGALPQVASLRERFEYNNLMYLFAGELLARRSGMPWEEFVAAEIFRPLGMTRTSTDLRKMPELPNVATPYIRTAAGVVPVPHASHQNTAAAGAIYSSANDLGRWLRFLLNGGELDGKRLLRRESLDPTMTPQMLIGHTGPADELLFPGANFIAYGMGWFISDYQGRKMLSHTGGTDGMAAFISLLPRERLGVAILTNVEGDMARAVIRNWLFDRYLGAKGTDWRAAYSRWLEPTRTHAAEMAKAQRDARDVNSRPHLALAAYAGRYTSDLFGTVEVRLGPNQQLEWRLAELPFSALAAWQQDSFRIEWPTIGMNEPVYSLLTFQLGGDGKPARVVVSGPMLDADVPFDANAR
ncbi:MAG: serine hydrolase [Gammaproteobacteria bacterium]